MLSKKYRFSLRTENTRFRKEGKKFYSPLFGFIWVDNSNLQIGNPRFSVLLSKKVSSKATVRNKVKRTIYDIIRDLLPDFSAPADILIIPTLKCASIDKEILKTEIVRALKRIA